MKPAVNERRGRLEVSVSAFRWWENVSGMMRRKRKMTPYMNATYIAKDRTIGSKKSIPELVILYSHGEVRKGL